MQSTGNTILITGGASGIGRGLAEAFLKLGNTVIIAGRRKTLLDEVADANPGMKSLVLDVEDRTAIRAFSKRLASEFPALNVLVNNAGIMRMENLLEQQDDLSDAEATITTNLLGPIRLTAALLPLLQKHPHSAVINVTSGLAYVPLALTPTYCATKAALHSYTLSLRYQLKDTTTEVVEIAPPYVQTDLMDGAEDPRAMPLTDFIKEAMSLLTAQPTPTEVCVKNVHPLRFAEKEGRFDATFKGLNDAMASRP
jgi:uncharacterized oxidoreductase